jgi:WD40 repeat protein
MAPRVNVKKIARLTGHNAAIFALSADSEMRYFLSGAGDGWVVRWDFETPELGRLLAKADTQIFSMLHLPDRRTVVVGNMNGGVHWIDLDQPEATRNIAQHRKGVFGIVRAGDQAFTIGGEGGITRWSIDKRRPLETLRLSNQSLRGIDYCAQRGELAVGASDNAIYLLDAATLNVRQILAQAHENSVFVVRYTPDGRYLLSGGRDAHLKVWDLEREAAPVHAQPAHWFTINDIVFHPEGRWFATASRDKTIKIWNPDNFQLLKVLESARDRGHLNSVNRLLWSSYRDYLVSAGDDRGIIVWEVSEFDDSVE